MGAVGDIGAVVHEPDHSLAVDPVAGHQVVSEEHGTTVARAWQGQRRTQPLGHPEHGAATVGQPRLPSLLRLGRLVAVRRLASPMVNLQN